FDLPADAAAVHIWMPAEDYLTDGTVSTDYLLSYTGQNGRAYYHNSAYRTCDRRYVAFSVLVTDDMNDVKVTLIGK
nr:hypothetical protein [Lachnospiraceae bacterium]